MKWTSIPNRSPSYRHEELLGPVRVPEGAGNPGSVHSNSTLLIENVNLMTFGVRGVKSLEECPAVSLVESELRD